MKKKNTPPAEDFAARADKSTRHFISKLAGAIIELPTIKAHTPEDLQNATNAILDDLMESFISAQGDAFKFGITRITDALGIKPIFPPEEEDVTENGGENG